MSETPKIFISHSKEDNDIVEKIVVILKEYSIEYWIDKEQLDQVDSNVISKINEGLQTNNHFLLVWSKNAEKSDWVKREHNAATSGDYDKQLRKIIIRLDDTKLPPVLAPNKYHRANSTNIESVIKGILKMVKGEFKTQVKLFKEDVIKDFETFPDKPIIPNFKKFNAYKYYVQQPFQYLSNPRQEGFETANDILGWFPELKKGLTLIVGDYGGGKSSLCHYVLYKLCQMDDFDLIPIFVALGSLKNHDNNVNKLKNELYDYVKEQYKFVLDLDLFDALVNEGKILFILDALDELSTTIDSDIAQRNLDFSIELSNSCPVLLTSRFTYIENNIPKRLVSYENSIQVLDFTEEQIERFLELKFEQNFEKIQEITEKIKNEHLKQIIAKPLFLNILCEKFEDLKNISYINEAVLFRILTNGWIKHDIIKSSITTDEKEKKIEERQRCSEILAIAEYKSGNPINLQEIIQVIEEEFQYEHADIANHFKQYYKDARDATFLTVEGDNSYRFILRPFLEFFVATRIIRDISVFQTKNNIKNIVLKVSPEIRSFIKAITEVDWLILPLIFDQIKEDPDRFKVESNIQKHLVPKINFSSNLVSIINKFQNHKEINIGNAVRILCDSNNLPERPNLSNLNISKIDLNNTSIIKGNFTNSDLSNASLINFHGVESKFSTSDFRNVTMDNAVFVKGLLDKTKFINAKGEHVVFTNADLRDANFSGANLYLANFGKANLTKANFLGATIARSNFVDAILNDTDFSESDLSDSYLSGQELSSTILTNCNLSHSYLHTANLSRASYSGVRFDNALLTNATFRESKLVDCDFSDANLCGVDLQDGIFHQIIFDGANLKHAKIGGADFTDASFRGSDVSGLDFSNSKIDGANFDNAKKDGTKGLS